MRTMRPRLRRIQFYKCNLFFVGHVVVDIALGFFFWRFGYWLWLMLRLITEHVLGARD